MSEKEVVHCVKHGRCRVEIICQKGQKAVHYSVRPVREYADPSTGDTKRAWNYYERDRKDRAKAETEAWAWIDNARANDGVAGRTDSKAA